MYSNIPECYDSPFLFKEEKLDETDILFFEEISTETEEPIDDLFKDKKHLKEEVMDFYNTYIHINPKNILEYCAMRDIK